MTLVQIPKPIHWVFDSISEGYQQVIHRLKNEDLPRDKVVEMAEDRNRGSGAGKETIPSSKEFQSLNFCQIQEPVVKPNRCSYLASVLSRYTMRPMRRNAGTSKWSIVGTVPKKDLWNSCNSCN